MRLDARGCAQRAAKGGVNLGLPTETRTAARQIVREQQAYRQRANIDGGAGHLLSGQIGFALGLQGTLVQIRLQREGGVLLGDVEPSLHQANGLVVKL